MEIERYVWDWASRQHGVVGRRQLHELGFTDVQILGLDRRESVEHLSCEVMRVRGTPDSGSMRAMAAVLDAPPGAILSHTSAAALWQVPGFDHRGEMHVTVPRQGVRTRTRLGVIHFHKDLPLSETVAREGIPVTTPTLTMFHLAATLHPARAERAFDHMQARRLTTPSRLAGLVEAIGARGRNGTRVARSLAAAASDRPSPASGFERRVDELAAAAGVRVRRQVPLGDHEFVGRVDFRLVHAPGVIEAQSLTYHASPLSADDDRERFRRLNEMGLSVLTIWDYQAFHRPEAVCDQIRRFASDAARSSTPFHRDCPDP